MNKAFNIELFLSGVLRGSSAPQVRHIRQARVMQRAIQKRWRHDNPWNWRHKHIQWFLVHHLEGHHETTRYYYQLTALLIWKRMGKTPFESIRIDRAR